MHNFIKYTLLIAVSLFLVYCTGSNNRSTNAKVSIADLPGVEFSTDKELGTLKLVKGNIANLNDFDVSDPVQSAFEIIQLFRNDFKLFDPENELILSKNQKDDLGFIHITFERVINRVPIFGDELKLHFNKRNNLYYINGNYHPSQNSNINPSPSLAKAKAEETALGNFSDKNKISIQNSRLVFLPINGKLKLSYEINLIGKESYPFNNTVFIDAETGKSLGIINNLNE